MSTPVVPSSPPPFPGAVHKNPTRTAWWRRRWVAGLGFGLLGLAVGAGVGAAAAHTDPTTTPEYKSLADKLGDSETNATSLQGQLDAAKTRLTDALGTIPSREAALKSGEAQLKSDQSALRAEKASVEKREKAVGIVERTIARNTISGDGIYEVGTDIKAGQYKTQGGSECYYAVLNSSDTNDIADNNNVSGPAIVDVHAGQYLELSGCNDFVWQR